MINRDLISKINKNYFGKYFLCFIILRALDVSEEGTFSYGTQTITVHVDTLIEIRALGWGHFGNVMLAEVRNYSGFQMAVKVS